MLLGGAEGIAWVRLNDSVTIPVGATILSLLLPGVSDNPHPQSVSRSVSQLNDIVKIPVRVFLEGATALTIVLAGLGSTHLISCQSVGRSGT